MTTNKYVMSREQMRGVWQNADWLRVIDAFGLNIDQKKSTKQNEIWIRSPFTKDKNASLHLDLTRNIFKDFSSGKGAQKGILNFCQELLSRQGSVLNCYEVAQWMIDQGVSRIIPGTVMKLDYVMPQSRDEKEKKNISSTYEKNTPIRVDLRPWLQPNHPELERRGISTITSRYLGCGYLSTNGKKQSPLNGRIVFQIRGIHEMHHKFKPTILTHVGRALTKEQETLNGKYWSFPFKKGLEIFNQDKLITDKKARIQIKQDGLIFVEGFFDVAKLVEAGCLNVGALMGAQISEKQLARLKYIDAQVNIPKITLFLDRDATGIAGARKIHQILQGSGFKSKIFNWDQVFLNSKGSPFNIPEKIKDPCDMTSIQINWLKKKGAI